MAKTNKINIEEVWGYELLYPILQDAFKVLNVSFQNLFPAKHKNPYTRPIDVKKWHLEDLITDDLIRDEDNLPKSFKYRIVNQQKDANKKTRIDIAIQWSLTFGYAYDIKVECKLLNKDNLNYYVDGGLRKFKTNIYSEKLPLAGMLAYNTTGLVSENIQKLNAKIDSKYSKDESLNQFDIFNGNQYGYKSTHLRISNSSIDIYTMVLDFKDIIKN